MALIKKLKKFFTGEDIYPVTSSQAVYDTSGARLDKILQQTIVASGSVEDTEIDGIALEADKVGNYTAKEINDFIEKVYNKEVGGVSEEDIINTLDGIVSNTDTEKLAGALAMKEFFQYVGNKKESLASAITDRGVDTDVTNDWDTVLANAEEIRVASGTAQKNNVLEGFTFTNADGIEYEGTMPDKRGIVIDVDGAGGDADYVFTTMPEGYYDETSMVRLARETIILNGEIIYLGTGNSFDLSGVKGYKTFTVDNFLVFASGDDYASGHHGSGTDTTFMAWAIFSTAGISYNQDIGVLTITPPKLTAVFHNHKTTEKQYTTVDLFHKVYLVMGEVGSLYDE